MSYLDQIVIIEITKNSRLKYEIDKGSGRLLLDRVLYGSCCYPYSYGYIDSTLDGDGDPLDVVIISQESFQPGSMVPVRVVGAMKMIDHGEKDTKLIAVVNVDPRYKEWNSLKDVPKGIVDEIHDFFSNYKKLENKEVVIEGFVEDLKEVEKIILESIEHYRNTRG